MYLRPGYITVEQNPKWKQIQNYIKPWFKPPCRWEKITNMLRSSKEVTQLQLKLYKKF